MKDNFVKILSMTGLRNYVMLCLMFVGVSMFSSLNAQYVGKEQAIQRLLQASTSVASSISNLPASSLESRYGNFQISVYKTIYADLVENASSTADAVNKTFASFDANTDSNYDNRAIMLEYNKKYPTANTLDVYNAIKKHIQDLLKG